LERIRAGDSAALMELLQQYEGRLRTAARVLLGPWLRPHLDSVDLVQSAYCALLPEIERGRYDFSTPEKLVGLAVTIIRRKVARIWRRLKRQEPFPDSAAEDEGDAAALVPDPKPGDNPAEQAALNDGLEHLLQQLSDEERNLVEARLLGYSTV